MTSLKEIAQSLEERMMRDVGDCINHGTEVKVGKQKYGSPISYCTYFFIGAGREPVDCAYRGERVTVMIDSVLGTVPLEFYKCKRWKKE